jgi:hypothetical protein
MSDVTTSLKSDDKLAASAAEALALRAIMRYRNHRENVLYYGGKGVLDQEFPELAPDLPNEYELSSRYSDLMNGGWIHEHSPSPVALSLYLDLAIAIVTDAMADTIGVDDNLYHALTLLTHLQPALGNMVYERDQRRDWIWQAERRSD